MEINKSYSLQIQEIVGVDLDYDKVVSILAVLSEVYGEAYEAGYIDAMTGVIFEGVEGDE